MNLTYPDLYSAVMVSHMASNALDHISAKAAGAWGGIFASGVQFWSSTLDDFVTAAFSLDFLAVKLFVAFLIGLGGYAFFGGLFAYFLQALTQSRLSWFLAGALATSTPVNTLPVAIKFLKRVDLSPISSAYAQESKPCDDITRFTILDGLKQFFGLDEPGYRVVVGSFKRTSDAQAFANKINSEDSSLNAFVGNRAPCNDFYPVIVGPYSSSLYDAKKTLNKALALESKPSAYISKRPN